MRLKFPNEKHTFVRLFRCSSIRRAAFYLSFWKSKFSPNGAQSEASALNDLYKSIDLFYHVTRLLLASCSNAWNSSMRKMNIPTKFSSFFSRLASVMALSIDEWHKNAVKHFEYNFAMNFTIRRTKCRNTIWRQMWSALPRDCCAREMCVKVQASQ